MRARGKKRHGLLGQGNLLESKSCVRIPCTNYDDHRHQIEGYIAQPKDFNVVFCYAKCTPFVLFGYFIASCMPLLLSLKLIDSYDLERYITLHEHNTNEATEDPKNIIERETLNVCFWGLFIIIYPKRWHH